MISFMILNGKLSLMAIFHGHFMGNQQEFREKKLGQLGQLGLHGCSMEILRLIIGYAQQETMVIQQEILEKN